MREAARAVTPVEEAGFWERLRAGMRMMVLHPAMTAAVVLVVVMGISFTVYQRGGPPSLEPKADDLPPVPPVASTATGQGGAAELAAAPQRLKEEERARDETVGEANKADNLKQMAQTETTDQEGKAGLQKAAGRLANAVGSASTPNDYKNAPRADKLGTALPVATRGRRATARPAVARSPVYRKGPGGTRALKDAFNSDDLSGGDADYNKKKGAGSLDSLSGGGKYAKAPPPKAKPRPRRRARSRPQPTPKLAYAPNPAPSTEPQAEAAPQAAKPAPRPAKTTTAQASTAHNAYHWVARGDLAMKKGDCKSALGYYDQALRLQPGLSKKVSGMVQRCAAYIGRDGEKKLMLAAKRYPRLAGYFTREISRQRTEAKARANREAGAPSTGKVRASKRRAKARKAPAKAKARPAQQQQAPTGK